MLMTLMRRNATKCMAIRGGHGWDRPDVPLTIPYTHKRRMDVFDTNLWFYCGVMPEYFINQNEAYLVSMQQAAKQFFIDARFIFAAFVACYFMDKILFEPRFWNVVPDHLKNPTFNFPRKVIKERSTMVKHFLDLSDQYYNLGVTGDMGKLRITPGEKGYLNNITEIYEEQNTHVQQINAEGKGFIERVEAESRRAVAQRHGEQQSAHHSNH